MTREDDAKVKADGEQDGNKRNVGEPVTISLNKSDGDKSLGDGLLAVKRVVDGHPVQKGRHGREMEVEKIIKPQVTRTRMHKKQSIVKKWQRKTKINLAEHAPKYEFLPNLAKDSCGLKFRQLLRGDAVEAKKELDRIFRCRNQLKIGVVGGSKDHGSRVLRIILILV